jgi:peptide/nickel transport system substrate-binding protein
MWTFNDEVVELIFLIRNDSDGTRIPIGDYISTQLEAVGFAVDRQYKTSSEASAIWVLGDPADGLWHLYTGAWSTSAISRDDATNFVFFYSPKSGYGFTGLWQSYAATMTEEQHVVFDALNESTFTSPEERAELFAQAMEMTFDINTRIWLIDGRGRVPWAADLAVASDLAAGITTNRLWPYTLRYIDDAGLPVEGGLIQWGAPDLFVDPANPIGGSNWTYDSMWQIATQDQGVIPNPSTGIALPQRLERAELVVQEGLPISNTYDWVDLSFAAEIAVPADAWNGWDAEAGTFTTAGEGVTSLTKTVAYYPAGMYESMTWHDGSPLSAADFVMGMIMTYTPGTEGTDVYDEAQAGALEATKSTLKGIRIVSTDPLVIETYSDGWTLDAENVVTTWWPVYAYGTAPWHSIAMGNAAEAAGELAYSADKSETAEIEWTNFIAGPSLEILSGQLDTLAADATIPYPNVLGDYITAEEAAARYANLQAWYAAQNHFWVGTGPFYLDDVFSVEKTATLTRYENYPDLADRWLGFAAPKISDVEVDGPGRVTIGEAVDFNVYVTYEGAAYPADEIDNVKYLLFDASGEIVEVGQATLVTDGEYVVSLSADSTALLSSGSGKLEIAVVAIPVAIPTFGSFEFVAE